MSVPVDWDRVKHITAPQLVFGLAAAAVFSMPLGTSPPTIASVALAAVWVFSGTAFRVRRLFFTQEWCRPVLFFMILPWIALTYSLDPGGLGLDYAGKTHYWLYGLALASVASEFDTERIVQAFIAGLALNAGIGVLQLIGVMATKKGLYCGVGPGYNTLSAYLILGMMITAYYFKQSVSNRFRLLALAATALFFFQLVILQGRTGYFTFLVLCPFILRNLLPKVRIAVLVAGCTLVAAVMLLSPVVRQRVDLTIQQLRYHLTADADKAWGREYTVNQDRFYMWYGAVHIFLDNPLFGVGTGGYSKALKARGRPGDPYIAHPHNDFLYMAASYGVVGIAAFVWLFWVVLKNSWKERHHPVGYFVFSTALVVLVSGLFNGQILDVGMAFPLVYAVGLQAGFSAFARRETGIMTIRRRSDTTDLHILSKRSFRRRAVFDACFVSEQMIDVLNHPDAYLKHENTRILQDNFKSTIGVISVDGRKIVVKRHNYKSRWNRFKRFFRRTRAQKCWTYARLLSRHGILVPRPVGFVETRIGPLRGRSYFFYEYIDGLTGEAYLRKYRNFPVYIERAIDAMVALVGKIKDLRLIHGDIRVSNFIFREHDLYLLDLDDMRPRSWYKPSRTKNRDRRGLVKDIHYNVPNDIQNLFLERLGAS